MISLSSLSQFIFRSVIAPFLSYIKLKNGVSFVNTNTLMSYLFFKESVGLGAYESGVISLIKKYVRSGGVIDVGANEGYFSLMLAASLPSDSTKILALEANPSTYKSLSLNVQNNKFTNIHCLNKAVSEKDNDVVSISSESNYFRSHASTTYDLYTNESSAASIHTQTIDTLYHLHLGGWPLSFLKIDVEGFEIPVLKGAKETIALLKPIMLIEAQEVETLNYLYHNYSGLYYFFEINNSALRPFPSQVYPGMNLLMLPLNVQ